MTATAPETRGQGRPLLGLLPVLPRPAWVVLGGDFVSAVGSGLTLPCLFLYAHRVHGLSSATAGLIVSTVAVASLLGNPLGGALADRGTPCRALMVGLTMAAAGSIALALAQSALALFAAAGLLGVGVAVMWPAQDALLAGLVGPAGRSSVFSVRHASLNAGLGLGALIAAAVIDVAHPATFVAVYVVDAVTFLAFVPVLACLESKNPPTDTSTLGSQQHLSYWAVLQDRTFLRVWALTALVVTISFGQVQASFTGYATRPGGIGARGLSLAFAANTIAVVGAQLFVLRRLAGHRRTTAVALAAVTWAVTWAVVILAGQLGSGAPAELAFLVAMVVFALGETLLAPTLPAVVNDLAPPELVGRYNGLGVLAFTTGFLLGPALGAAALGAGWGRGLFILLVVACLGGAGTALRLGRHLPATANHIPAPSASPTQPG
jgi:MFS family permease